MGGIGIFFLLMLFNVQLKADPMQYAMFCPFCSNQTVGLLRLCALSLAVCLAFVVFSFAMAVCSSLA